MILSVICPSGVAWPYHIGGITIRLRSVSPENEIGVRRLAVVMISGKGCQKGSSSNQAALSRETATSSYIKTCNRWAHFLDLAGSRKSSFKADRVGFDPRLGPALDSETLENIGRY
jgi:hypothetical protein